MPSKSPKSKKESGKTSATPETTELEESPQLPKPSTNPIPESLTQEEILAQGREAAELLNSPVYNIAHKMVLDQIFSQWLESAGDASQERERLHQKAQALGETAAMLLIMINEAQGLNLSEGEQAEQDLAEYMENQGFGLSEAH